MAHAERVLSTAHKAKGLEWNQVVLEDGFPTLEELDETDEHGRPCCTAKERDQELHLLYVAATRATDHLLVSLHHLAPAKNPGHQPRHAAKPN